MFGNPFSPYWWMPQLPIMPQPAIRRVDIGGIRSTVKPISSANCCKLLFVIEGKIEWDCGVI